MQNVPAAVFGSSFSPAQRRAASHLPSIPRTSTFTATDRGLVDSVIPPVRTSPSGIDAKRAAFAAQRVTPSITMRELNARDNYAVASDVGAGVARQAAQQAVLSGFMGLAGAGCTSTGGQVAQSLLSTAGTTLSTVAAPTTTTTTTTSGVQMSQSTQTALAISGAATQLISGIYAGVCQAQAATRAPTTGAGTSGSAQVASSLTALQAANSGASTTPSAGGTTTQSQPATQPAKDNTLLYVGIGAAALIGIVLVMR